MDTRQYAGVTHARLRKAAQGAGPSAKWVQCRRLVLVSGRQMAACEPVSDNGGWTKADKFARHIAAANPAAVLAMLARIDQMEAERADLLAMLEQARQQLSEAEGAATRLAREAVTFMNQRDRLLAAAVDAYELLKVIHDETGKVGSKLHAAIAAVKGNQP